MEPIQAFQLRVTAKQSVSLLPRCLQILSRRGLILVHLRSEEHADTTVSLYMDIAGPVQWHNAVPDLLARLHEVTDVQKEAYHA